MTGGLCLDFTDQDLHKAVVGRCYGSLSDGPVINIGCCADDYYNDVSSIDQDVNNTYKNLCPPYPKYFMEYDAPLDGIQVGVSIAAAQHGEWDDVIFQANTSPSTRLAAKRIAEGCKSSFVLCMVFFASPAKENKVVPVGIMFLGIVESQYVTGGNYHIWPTHSALGDDAADLISRACNIVLVAHEELGRGFLSPVGPTPKPRIVRQSKKRIGEPAYGWRHHTIIVKPNDSKKSDGVYIDLNDEETMRPFHAVRAHYATYTKDKPLFGKYVGRFYVPAHFRGKPENGFVTKDYHIIPHGVRSAS
ncbi:MAG: hypothetical protein EBY40_00170 [Marivivens sp.]|nr:hypothetical protein [Marivivens sp.]NBT50030.1 hypothetical protein [Marivivens sp.]NCW67022.1 hypothetical protein [Marivivens sp.]NDH01524.1 hypothetical protein [Marivivens sp.]